MTLTTTFQNPRIKTGIAFYFCQINEKMPIPKGNLNKPTDALVNFMNQLINSTDDEKEI